MGGFQTLTNGPVSNASPVAPGAFGNRRLYRIDATHALCSVDGVSDSYFTVIDYTDPYNVLWAAAWGSTPDSLIVMCQVDATRFVALFQPFAPHQVDLRLVTVDTAALTVSVGPSNLIDLDSPAISEPWLSSYSADNGRFPVLFELVSLDSDTVAFPAIAGFSDFGLTPSTDGQLAYLVAVSIGDGTAMAIVDQEFIRTDVVPAGSSGTNHYDAPQALTLSHSGQPIVALNDSAFSDASIWSVNWSGGTLSYTQLSASMPYTDYDWPVTELYQLIDTRWLVTGGGTFYVAASDFSSFDGPHPVSSSTGHDLHLEFGGFTFSGINGFKQALSGLIYSRDNSYSWQLDEWEHPRANGNFSDSTGADDAIPVETTGGDSAMLNRLWQVSRPETFIGGLATGTLVLRQLEEIPFAPVISSAGPFDGSSISIAEGTAVLFDNTTPPVVVGGVSLFTPDKHWHPLTEMRIDWGDGTVDVIAITDLTLDTNNGHLLNSPADVSHVYARPGVYRVFATVYDSSGLVDIDDLGAGEATVYFPPPAIPPPQRQFPRDDGLAISTKRSYPPPTSIQFGQRQGPTAIR